ncbi:hypothetical protein GCM10010357_29260 [Streptomyces luteireticuli]|uniref:Helix-turn-helix domain-containing protein n=2 Tax=Streptomyces luteireticuli TaxID=173858 RepID=A0ABN0YR88_9ACTN
MTPLSKDAPQPLTRAGRLMTPADVAEYLGKPTSWVYSQWRGTGIPFRKVGNQLRCRPGDLDNWFDQQAA